MSEKKIGLITLHTGFNYGTLLQAYAMNRIIEEVGYEPFMIWHKDGLIKGRDVTFSKLFVMFFRLLRHPFAYKKTIGAYVNNFSYEMPEKTKLNFLEFSKQFYKINKLSYSQMKKICKSEEIKAVICGSDQIWNADALYVSPYYFLRFVPKNKRISFSPSFGKGKVPEYNKKIISKYLKDFSSISVREESGKKIVKELTDRNCPVTLDPTLAVSSDLWKSFINDNAEGEYILCYFLDEPTEKMVENIKKIQNENKLKLIYLPYQFKCFEQIENSHVSYASPLDFLNLINYAKVVFTDSFHASVFSLIFHTPFFTIERNHKSASSQSTRVQNLLSLAQMEERLIQKDAEVPQDILFLCNFENADENIQKEREKSLKYLKESIESVK